MTLKNCNHGKITATILSSPIGELEMKCCLKGVISLGTVSKKILHDEFHPDERYKAFTVYNKSKLYCVSQFILCILMNMAQVVICCTKPLQ